MRAARSLAAAALAGVLAFTACTGVRDEEGWRKALTKNYPCEELLDIAADLPSDVDPEMVADDLRARGCDPAAIAKR